MTFQWGTKDKVALLDYAEDAVTGASESLSDVERGQRRAIGKLHILIDSLGERCAPVWRGIRVEGNAQRVRHGYTLCGRWPLKKAIAAGRALRGEKRNLRLCPTSMGQVATRNYRLATSSSSSTCWYSCPVARDRPSSQVRLSEAWCAESISATSFASSRVAEAVSSGWSMPRSPA